MKVNKKEIAMADVAIKLPKKKLIEGLSSLSFKEMKEIIDSMIQSKLFRSPTADNIYKEASGVIKKQKLSEEVSIEAVKWSRRQK